MKYLGIDMGTSFIKSAVLDLEENQITDINRRKAPDPTTASDSLRKEYEITAIADIVKHLIKKHLSSDRRIAGIVFATQMHGFVLMNSNFKPVTNYISWEDERGLEKFAGGSQTYLEMINERLPKEEIKKTGMEIKPGLAAVNLFHRLQNNEINNEEDLYFCTLGDYIISHLSGEKPYTHLTNAAASGLVNLDTDNWNENIIDRLNFKDIILPEIIDERKSAGYLKMNGHKISLHPALGDHQAAILGVLLTPGKELSINIGTGSQMTLIEDELEYGNYESRPYPGNKFLRTITHIPGGRALDVLINFVKDIGNKIFDIENFDESKIWQRIMDEVENCDYFYNNDLEVNVSFFEGLTIPYEGSIKNIQPSNFSIENIFVGAFNRMGHYYDDMFTKLSVSKNEVEKIIFSGGAARKNKILRDLIAQKIGLQAELAPFVEDTLVGLFQLALVCSGICEEYLEAENYSHNLQIVK